MISEENVILNQNLNRINNSSHIVLNIKERMKILNDVKEIENKIKVSVEIKKEITDLVSINRFSTNETYEFLNGFIPNLELDDLVNIFKLSKLCLKENKKKFPIASINDLYLKLFYELNLIGNDNPHKLILSQKIVELMALILALLFNENRKKLKCKTIAEFINNLETEKKSNLFSDCSKTDSQELGLEITKSNIGKNISGSYNNSLNNISMTMTLYQKEKFFFFNLSDMFENIKSLVFEFPRENVSLNSYIIFMMNLKWMFKNILEVEVNFEPTGQKILNFFYNLNKPMAQTFYILSYFIPEQFTSIQSLKIKIPYSFNKELHEYLNYNSKILHFIEFFEKYTNLNNLEIHFNAIDHFLFKKILQLIYKNKNLRSLCLNIFPSSTDLYSKIYLKNYSTIEYKNNCKQNLKQVKKLRSISLINSKIEMDINSLLIRLYDNFEINFEFLFSVLSIRLNKLNSFFLTIDFPEILNTVDRFILIMHKFLFDFLSYLKLGTNFFQTIDINAEKLIIDKRKYTYLSEFIEKLNLNFIVNKQLLNFYLILKLNKIEEINKFIPYASLEYIKLGDLDIESFTNFINFFSNKKSMQNLKFIHLIISSINPNPILNHSQIRNFITCQKPKELNQVVLHLRLFFNHDGVLDLINSIPNDSVKIYEISFCENMIINKDLLEIGREENFDGNNMNNPNEYFNNTLQFIDCYKIKKFYYEKYPKYLKLIYCFQCLLNKKNIELSKYKSIILIIIDFLKFRKEKIIKVKFDI